VSCRDANGVEHTVEVTAQSLYEAVAQALRAFREDDWTESPERGPSTLAVTIKQPAIEHIVRIRDFQKLARFGRQESCRNGVILGNAVRPIERSCGLAITTL